MNLATKLITALVILKLKGANDIIKVLRSKMDLVYKPDEASIAFDDLSRAYPQVIIIDLGDATWMEDTKDEWKFLTFIDHELQVLKLPEPPTWAEKSDFFKNRADSKAHGWYPMICRSPC